jgi:hypothetical protein
LTNTPGLSKPPRRLFHLSQCAFLDLVTCLWRFLLFLPFRSLVERFILCFVRKMPLVTFSIAPAESQAPVHSIILSLAFRRSLALLIYCLYHPVSLLFVLSRTICNFSEDLVCQYGALTYGLVLAPWNTILSMLVDKHGLNSVPPLRPASRSSGRPSVPAVCCIS